VTAIVSMLFVVFALICYDVFGVVFGTIAWLTAYALIRALCWGGLRLTR
jgi:hypothetical protein